MARTHADSLAEFLEGEGGGGQTGHEPGPSASQQGQGAGGGGVGDGGAAAAAPPSEMDSLVATVLEGSMHVLEKARNKFKGEAEKIEET